MLLEEVSLRTSWLRELHLVMVGVWVTLSLPLSLPPPVKALWRPDAKTMAQTLWRPAAKAEALWRPVDAARAGTHWRLATRAIGWDLLEAGGSGVDWNPLTAGPLLGEKLLDDSRSTNRGSRGASGPGADGGSPGAGGLGANEGSRGASGLEADRGPPGGVGLEANMEPLVRTGVIQVADWEPPPVVSWTANTETLAGLS